MPSRLRFLLAPSAAALILAAAPQAQAFCGFYVARADASLWNQASQVALVRDGERTVLTMSNDYQGELTDFALVVPVPAVLQKEQIHVSERKFIERLDAFSSPRLVEYFDEDPCRMRVYEAMDAAAAPAAAGMSARAQERAKALGVRIEAQYTVGEYDILILSAEQSNGLETWLRESGYKLPAGASAALAPYIRQGLKFFVAKVNLKEQAKTGFRYLRPLQMAYESPRFMLPIRLGMLNAKGPQDLIVYTLTRKGRVESSNYRSVKVPSEVEIPVYVKGEFQDFYRAMFHTAWEKEGRKAVFLEYFWNMGWCDPCAADPLTPDELKELGVFWLGEGGGPGPMGGGGAPGIRAPQPVPMPGGPMNVLLTRLHVRYDEAHFPEDLVFQETADQQNFQGRYILRHPFTGSVDCDQGRQYRRGLVQRYEQEAQTLARLTGWDIAAIRRKMGPPPGAGDGGGGEPPPRPTATSTPSPTPADPWWKRIWK